MNGERDEKEGVSRKFGKMTSEEVTGQYSKDGEGESNSKEDY